MTLDDEKGLGEVSQIALFWFLTAEPMADWHELDAYHEVLELRSSAGTITIIGIGLELICA